MTIASVTPACYETWLWCVVAHPAVNRENPMAKRVRAVPRIQNLSTRELAALASHESQKMLGVSAKKAYAMLDKGELRGTVAEAELRMLRFLRGE